jgi:hypothetical protein
MIFLSFLLITDRCSFRLEFVTVKNGKVIEASDDNVSSVRHYVFCPILPNRVGSFHALTHIFVTERTEVGNYLACSYSVPVYLEYLEICRSYVLTVFVSVNQYQPSPISY